MASRYSCRRCRGCNFGKSLQNPAGSVDLAGSKFALVDLAVVGVAAVGVAAADRTWSDIPFVLLLHSDHVLPDYAAAVVGGVAAAAVVADSEGVDCNGR